MQGLMNLADMQAVLDFNLSLLNTRKLNDVQSRFDRLSSIFPFNKAMLLSLDSKPRDDDEQGSVILMLSGATNSIALNEHLSSTDYLSSNKELAVALKQPEPFVICDPPRCKFNILGKNNLIGSISDAESSVSTVIALDFDRDRIDPKFIQAFQYVLPSLHEALMRSHDYANEALPKLSAREYEVLNWIKQGKSNWDIGHILSISERTVKYHIANICKKLDATNRTHALAKAMRYKLVH